ncbi:uncharacterized protein ColSpa_00288 [Colletotrichum spaethianum]|uniref:Uncharacterized protein n=1 Tax=Colletotrichum spaethianum TaxID=700344 RepID=A0AA37L957_9PEZI|nr:uncharacterized protein ColSpa_00288 [Colletotrichum spaethianum]GKT40107.1 hypothetical protein ColSpa_00288 [Colletotrichum spaethianum]
MRITKRKCLRAGIVGDLAVLNGLVYVETHPKHNGQIHGLPLEKPVGLRDDRSLGLDTPSSLGGAVFGPGVSVCQTPREQLFTSLPYSCRDRYASQKSLTGVTCRIGIGVVAPRFNADTCMRR